MGTGPCSRGGSQPWPHLRIPWEPSSGGGGGPAVRVVRPLPACLWFASGVQNRCCRRRLRGSDRRGDRSAEPLCPGPQTGACRNAGLRRRQVGSLACRVPVSSQVRRVVSTSRRSDRFRLVTPGAPEEDRLGIVYFFPLNVFLFHISDWVLVVKLLSVAQHDGHVCKSEVHSL